MNHEQKPSASNKKRVFSFGRRREEKLEAICLGETVELSEERALPAKGIVDVPFLLITAALVLFGCVMVYSASSVYAEQYHDDNTYFIARHLVFLLMAIAFTAVAVRFCTPRFLEGFQLYSLRCLDRSLAFGACHRRRFGKRRQEMDQSRIHHASALGDRQDRIGADDGAIYGNA